MIRRTAFFPIHWGIKRGQSFPCLLLTRMLQHKHQQKVQRVLSIAGRFLRPSDLLESLSAVIDEATRHQLGWLDTLGEPLAGEPAEAAYARRDKGPSPVSPISTTIEEQKQRWRLMTRCGWLVTVSTPPWWRRSAWAGGG